MNTELKNAVKATDSKAQYDTSAKRLLLLKVGFLKGILKLWNLD